MKKVLIDTSVWISYFKEADSHNNVSELIKNNQICTNDLILAELIPSLVIRNENEIMESLMQLDKIPIVINWDIIMNLQVVNLKAGINKVGIPDLIILENVLDNDLVLYTEDKHFKLMSEIMNVKLFKY